MRRENHQCSKIAKGPSSDRNSLLGSRIESEFQNSRIPPLLAVWSSPFYVCIFLVKHFFFFFKHVYCAPEPQRTHFNESSTKSQKIAQKTTATTTTCLLHMQHSKIDASTHVPRCSWPSGACVMHVWARGDKCCCDVFFFGSLKGGMVYVDAFV